MIINKLRDYFSRSTESPMTALDYPIAEEFRSLQFGSACIQKLLTDYAGDFSQVLDIGSGEGRHAELFRHYGKEVTEVDFGASPYYRMGTGDRKVLIGNYLDLKFPAQFDLVWLCHVLEHQTNVNLFLEKALNDLREGGLIAITVPPMKTEIVGGHLSIWNAGLLLYNLIVAGFDCKDAQVLSYGYNISVILKKRSITLPELIFDSGDIETLSDFFPPGLTEPFEGNINELNWINRQSTDASSA